MAFITDATLTTKVAGILKLAEADLPSYWTVIIADANLSAYQDIVGHLLRRGFTKAQIDTWDRGAEFQKDIGLFWCLVKGAGLHGYDDKFIRLLDRRKELDEVFIIDGSMALEPAGVEQYGSGRLTTDNDQFRLDQYQDGALTEEGTRW